MPIMNRHLVGFRCIRCDARFPVADYPEGCPRCLAEAFPASVVPLYDAGLPPLRFGGIRNGMRRFADRLPYGDYDSLGEGDTPLVTLPRLAGELGLESLHLKLESANPTGSHKDRMSAQFVARAKDRGAPAVIAASSGNAGTSLAAYAGLAGIPCTIVTTRAISPSWRRALIMSGAEIIYAEDSLERWVIVRRKVREEGYASATNYLDPPVGSDAFGVDGYKTLGYELAEDGEAAAADVVIVPTARGDLMWGVYQGWSEAIAGQLVATMPRLVAAEPFPRLQAVMQGADLHGHFPGQSSLVSIAGPTVTYQAFEAVRRSGGTAVAVTQGAAEADQLALARLGLYLELSSVAPLTALRTLMQQPGSTIRRAVLVATSHGYKEPAS